MPACLRLGLWLSIVLGTCGAAALVLFFIDRACARLRFGPIGAIYGSNRLLALKIIYNVLVGTVLLRQTDLYLPTIRELSSSLV